MALPSSEPTVGETVSIEVECTDCGHTKWLNPPQLANFGIPGSTRLTALAERLSCSECRSDGLPGKNISVQAAFATEASRLKAERWSAVRTQAAHAAGLRARGA